MSPPRAASRTRWGWARRVSKRHDEACVLWVAKQRARHARGRVFRAGDTGGARRHSVRVWAVCSWHANAGAGVVGMRAWVDGCVRSDALQQRSASRTMVAGDGLLGQWRGRRGAVARATGDGDAGDGHSKRFPSFPSFSRLRHACSTHTRVSHTHTRTFEPHTHTLEQTHVCICASARVPRTYTYPLHIGMPQMNPHSPTTMNPRCSISACQSISSMSASTCTGVARAATTCRVEAAFVRTPPG